MSLGSRRVYMPKRRAASHRMTSEKALRSELHMIDMIKNKELGVRPEHAELFETFGALAPLACSCTCDRCIVERSHDCGRIECEASK